MSPGHDLCGRFRLRQMQETRADRTVWTANDLVTKRMVRVHIGQAGLVTEVAMLKRVQGRGVLPFIGLWREGTDVVLVFGQRLPLACLAEHTDVSPMRCVHWLTDLSAALSRLQVAGVALGTVVTGRIWVSGDRAWLDPTGPFDPARAVRADLTDLARIMTEVASPVARQRGPRQLLHLLRHPDPDWQPATALGLRRLAERAALHPKRPIGPARRVAFAPRASRQLIARGHSGTRVRVGAPVGAWRRLVWGFKLRHRPEQLRWYRTALGWSDVAVMAVLSGLAAVVVPCIGGPLALYGVWQWRRARCRPRAGDSLLLVEWDGEGMLASLSLAVNGELPPRPDSMGRAADGPGA